jgi:predicted metal-dependent hydrolase
VATEFPNGFLDGVRHFNAGRFFEAHEAFEEILEDVEEDERWDLLKALIKIAVGYHKAASRYAGAQRMLELGLEVLDEFPELAFGLELGRLRTRAREDLELIALGASWEERLARDPPRMTIDAGARRVRLKPSSDASTRAVPTCSKKGAK